MKLRVDERVREESATQCPAAARGRRVVADSSTQSARVAGWVAGASLAAAVRELSAECSTQSLSLSLCTLCVAGAPNYAVHADHAELCEDAGTAAAAMRQRGFEG